MYSTYIIKNLKSGRFYIGSTNNINRRLKEHNRKQTKSTRSNQGTWVLIFQEVYNSDIKAKLREKNN